MSDVDERLVHALCAAAATEPGAAEAAVRAHVSRLAPLAGPVAAERLVRAAVARLSPRSEALLRYSSAYSFLPNGGGNAVHASANARS